MTLTDLYSIKCVRYFESPLALPGIWKRQGLTAIHCRTLREVGLLQLLICLSQRRPDRSGLRYTQSSRGSRLVATPSA